MSMNAVSSNTTTKWLTVVVVLLCGGNSMLVSALAPPCPVRTPTTNFHGMCPGGKREGRMSRLPQSQQLTRARKIQRSLFRHHQHPSLASWCSTSRMSTELLVHSATSMHESSRSSASVTSPLFQATVSMPNTSNSNKSKKSSPSLGKVLVTLVTTWVLARQVPCNISWEWNLLKHAIYYLGGMKALSLMSVGKGKTQTSKSSYTTSSSGFWKALLLGVLAMAGAVVEVEKFLAAVLPPSVYPLLRQLAIIFAIFWVAPTNTKTTIIANVPPEPKRYFVPEELQQVKTTVVKKVTETTTEDNEEIVETVMKSTSTSEVEVQVDTPAAADTKSKDAKQKYADFWETYKTDFDTSYLKSIIDKAKSTVDDFNKEQVRLLKLKPTPIPHDPYLDNFVMDIQTSVTQFQTKQIPHYIDKNTRKIKKAWEILISDEDDFETMDP